MVKTGNDKPCPNCGHCPTCGRANTLPYFVPYPVYPSYPYGRWYPNYPYYTPTWINGGVTSMGVTTVAAAAGNPGSTYTYSLSAS